MKFCKRCDKGGDCSKAGHLGKENGKTKRNKALKTMTPEQRKAHRKKWRAEQKKLALEARTAKALKFVERHNASSSKPKTRAYVARLLKS